MIKTAGFTVALSSAREAYRAKHGGDEGVNWLVSAAIHDALVQAGWEYLAHSTQWSFDEVIYHIRRSKDDSPIELPQGSVVEMFLKKDPD